MIKVTVVEIFEVRRESIVCIDGNDRVAAVRAVSDDWDSTRSFCFDDKPKEEWTRKYVDATARE